MGRKRNVQTAMKREREQKRRERQAMKDAKKLAAVEARREAAMHGPSVEPERGE
jgi:hypothetical protein